MSAGWASAGWAIFYFCCGAWFGLALAHAISKLRRLNSSPTLSDER